MFLLTCGLPSHLCLLYVDFSMMEGYVRRFYIDNIRWMAVLVLFPYHAAMIWNDYDESFYCGYYVWAGENEVLGLFLRFVSPIFMPLLFVIAGMCARFSLERRTARQFLTERFLRLFVPLVAGIFLVVPVQTFFAERFHNGYTGGYFGQLVLFFTKVTDLTGYSGGFTPGNLWFLLYLFVISFVSLGVVVIVRKLKVNVSFEGIPFFVVLFLFVFPLVMTPVVNIGRKSLGMFFALFMLGYFVLSQETVLQKLDRYRYFLF